jgi:hypothetical protein
MSVPQATQIWSFKLDSTVDDNGKTTTDLDPKELADLHWARERFKQAEQLELQRPRVRAPETWVTYRHTPRSVRIAEWLWVRLSRGSRDGHFDRTNRPLSIPRVFVLWTLRLWPRVVQAGGVLLSGRAGTGVGEIRAAACEKCQYRKTTRSGRSYCGGCTCPAWIGSRLSVKNSRRRNHCPMRAHPGEYIEFQAFRWPIREAKTTETPENAAIQPMGARRKGCGTR